MSKMEISSKGDREILITREFNAPRRLVWDAYTKPELVKRWLFGPDGWEFAVCEIDLRVGGTYRYLWRRQDGREMGMGGEYREIMAPERLVSTGKFDDPWYPGEELCTMVLTEEGGKTALAITVAYESREARDGVLKSPMAEGMALGYDRLEGVLSTLL